MSFLYGTEVRGHTANGVTATAGGVSTPVLGAVGDESVRRRGPNQHQPNSGVGGKHVVQLTMDGVKANIVSVILQ